MKDNILKAIKEINSFSYEPETLVDKINKKLQNKDSYFYSKIMHEIMRKDILRSYA